jgi:hypothetical protein
MHSYSSGPLPQRGQLNVGSTTIVVGLQSGHVSKHRSSSTDKVDCLASGLPTMGWV